MNNSDNKRNKRKAPDSPTEQGERASKRPHLSDQAENQPSPGASALLEAFSQVILQAINSNNPFNITFIAYDNTMPPESRVLFAQAAINLKDQLAPFALKSRVPALMGWLINIGIDLKVYAFLTKFTGVVENIAPYRDQQIAHFRTPSLLSIFEEIKNLENFITPTNLSYLHHNIRQMFYELPIERAVAHEQTEEFERQIIALSRLDDDNFMSAANSACLESTIRTLECLRSPDRLFFLPYELPRNSVKFWVNLVVDFEKSGVNLLNYRDQMIFMLEDLRNHRVADYRFIEVFRQFYELQLKSPNQGTKRIIFEYVNELLDPQKHSQILPETIDLCLSVARTAPAHATSVVNYVKTLATSPNAILPTPRPNNMTFIINLNYVELSSDFDLDRFQIRAEAEEIYNNFLQRITEHYSEESLESQKMRIMTLRTAISHISQLEHIQRNFSRLLHDSSIEPSERSILVSNDINRLSYAINKLMVLNAPYQQGNIGNVTRALTGICDETVKLSVVNGITLCGTYSQFFRNIPLNNTAQVDAFLKSFRILLRFLKRELFQSIEVLESQNIFLTDSVCNFFTQPENGRVLPFIYYATNYLNVSTILTQYPDFITPNMQLLDGTTLAHIAAQKIATPAQLEQLALFGFNFGTPDNSGKSAFDVLIELQKFEHALAILELTPSVTEQNLLELFLNEVRKAYKAQDPKQNQDAMATDTEQLWQVALETGSPLAVSEYVRLTTQEQHFQNSGLMDAVQRTLDLSDENIDALSKIALLYIRQHGSSSVAEDGIQTCKFILQNATIFPPQILEVVMTSLLNGLPIDAETLQLASSVPNKSAFFVSSYEKMENLHDHILDTTQQLSKEFYERVAIKLEDSRQLLSMNVDGIDLMAALYKRIKRESKSHNFSEVCSNEILEQLDDLNNRSIKRSDKLSTLIETILNERIQATSLSF